MALNLEDPFCYTHRQSAWFKPHRLNLLCLVPQIRDIPSLIRNSSLISLLSKNVYAIVKLQLCCTGK